MNFWSGQIERGAQLRPDDFVFLDTHSRISYAELKEFTFSLAADLKRRGLGPGDRILLILPRGVAAAVCTSALLACGIPALAIERSNVVASLSSTVETLDPSAVIFLLADRERLATGLAIAGSQEIQFPFSTRDQIHIALRKPISNLSSPANLGWFLQTSGSTRAPRLVMIGRENLVERAKGEARDFHLSPSDEIINALSFTHDVGLNQLLATLASLSVLKIQNQPFAQALLNWIRLGTSTGLSATPLLWSQVMELTPETFPGFRYVAVSGGSLAPADLQRLAKMFPGAELLRTYGQTETFRSLLNRTNDFETLGSPIENVKLQIASDGELIHSGAGAMLGYFGSHVETEEKLSADGVHTGDFFEIAANGHYKFKGRRDDMIKRFDVRMHLNEIEEVISEIPGIANVALVTKPAPRDDVRENLIAAFITLVPGANFASAELTVACKQRLEPAKQPDTIEILSEMPRTPGHKIDRLALAKLWMPK